MNREAPRDGGAEPVRLGALEAQVMDLLWRGDPLTVRRIIERLPSEPAYTTIATVLSHLRRKGLVCAGKEGHRTLYGACVSREEHTARIMERALDDSGDRAASILRFVDGMAEDDLRLLRQHLLGSHDER
ncbi:BlaI/MecI/CopY family transcriptional regulator [Leucobacter triazinivorans]|uniref:BlaI/MecI/CopY family transcriptional regulator n=1 Tax=Leucobacter triazinivorans TaxID=1784719 RepID=A0A4P6KFL8_9MICO|nr:BlaI/MecI/CopY family transcriptional regulator [Leucobacter triazinivorans]QBE49275.1 BlaI/MecI/CopY family transcriptional regulator [Leucobacter triazinivorans]